MAEDLHIFAALKSYRLHHDSGGSGLSLLYGPRFTPAPGFIDHLRSLEVRDVYLHDGLWRWLDQDVLATLRSRQRHAYSRAIWRVLPT